MKMRLIMDLKTYAVFRKLTANSNLLQYLVDNKPVPINVLENDMKDLIDALHEPNAEMVVNDYPKYLREHVRVGIQTVGKNEYDISGDVEEPLMQSIELLHHVKRDDVVKNLVTSVMSDLKGDRELSVTNIDISASADEFVAMTAAPVFNDTKSEHDESYDVPLTAVTEVPKDANDVIGAHMVTSDDIPNDTALKDVDVPITNPVTQEQRDHNDELARQAAEEALASADLDEINTPLPQSVIDEPVGPVFEAPASDAMTSDKVAEVANEENGQTNLENPFRQAYDYLVNQLKERNIDERLPGLHLA